MKDCEAKKTSLTISGPSRASRFLKLEFVSFSTEAKMNDDENIRDSCSFLK